MMKTHLDIKSAAYIDSVVDYAGKLLGIVFKPVKKNRYNALCPFHADTKDNFMVYVDKKDEVRFHCFGACRGDWGIYDLIMLRTKQGFASAQQMWAEHLGIKDFKPYAGAGPTVAEPGKTPEPDDPVIFAEPKTPDEQIAAAMNHSAGFYNVLLMSDENQFRQIRDYLARQGVDRSVADKFNIGYAPPYSDARYQGRALTDSLVPRFENDFKTFKSFLDGGLIRFLNDNTTKAYGYYCRQIDFKRKVPFSRNYGDAFAGRIVFPIYDVDANPIGLAGKLPDDRGVSWLKHQRNKSGLSFGSWLYGIEKAGPFIRKYRTIIIVKGIFDYFAFYNLLQAQDKLVAVSTLGSYLTPETAAILADLGIEHFIVAHDCDATGRSGIERIAAKSGGWVYYLGGLAAGQTPYDMLRPVVKGISGFHLKHPYG
jgi:DNA primase